MTAVLKVTALLEYFDLLQFNVRMVAMPLATC